MYINRDRAKPGVRGQRDLRPSPSNSAAAASAIPDVDPVVVPASPQGTALVTPSRAAFTVDCASASAAFSAAISVDPPRRAMPRCRRVKEGGEGGSAVQ